MKGKLFAPMVFTAIITTLIACNPATKINEQETNQESGYCEDVVATPEHLCMIDEEEGIFEDCHGARYTFEDGAYYDYKGRKANGEIRRNP